MYNKYIYIYVYMKEAATNDYGSSIQPTDRQTHTTAEHIHYLHVSINSGTYTSCNI